MPIHRDAVPERSTPTVRASRSTLLRACRMYTWLQMSFQLILCREYPRAPSSMCIGAWIYSVALRVICMQLQLEVSYCCMMNFRSSHCSLQVGHGLGVGFAVTLAANMDRTSTTAAGERQVKDCSCRGMHEPAMNCMQAKGDPCMIPCDR